MYNKFIVVACVAITYGFFACDTHNHANEHAHETEEHDTSHSNHDHEHEETEHIHTEEDDHADYEDHDKEKEPVMYTKISAGYELFVELSDLVVNEPSEAIIHITRLEDYKPIELQDLDILLVSDHEHSIEGHAHVNGIFYTDFVPEHSGFLNMEIKFADQDKPVVLKLDSLEVHEENKEVHEHQEAFADLIPYLKEQAWNEDFLITEVVRKPFSRVIKTSGQIMPAPGDESIITALHSGTISLKSSLIEGKLVNKGEVLSTISSDLIHQNLTNDYLQAKNQYEKARIDYERASALLKEKLIAEREYLETKLNFESAKNSFNNISKFYSDGNENVEAPSRGYIRSVYVQQGQFIDEGQPIATLMRNKRILLKADVPQQYIHLAPGFYAANFSPVYSNKVFSTRNLKGKRVSYSQALSNNNTFTTVHFEFDATPDVIPGSYAEVYLKSASTSEVITLPVSALMEDQTNYFVFVMVDGEHYQKRYVGIGNSDGENIEIVSGIQEGEYVVSKGAYQVYLASLGNAAPAHTHSH